MAKSGCACSPRHNHDFKEIENTMAGDTANLMLSQSDDGEA